MIGNKRYLPHRIVRVNIRCVRPHYGYF